jgi:hypothetical protein
VNAVRRTKPGKILLAAGVAAFVVLAGLPFLVSTSYGVIEHRVCASTGPLATVLLWTPVILLNSPYGGNSTGSAVTVGPADAPAAIWSINLSAGRAGGLFSLDNWSLEHEQTDWAVGPGGASACSSSYVARDANRTGVDYAGNLLHTAYLGMSANFTDANESTNWSGEWLGRSYGSVQFNNSYSPPTDGAYLACGNDAAGWADHASSSTLDVAVPFSLDGRPLLIPTSLMTPDSYEYSIPAGPTGTWSVSDLASGPGGGLAFQWMGCVDPGGPPIIHDLAEA